ncbi:MAG: metalloregulator ArsR/SmtB family transcription factor [Acidobacteriia bacterium]|nr:metalloregulator ArsR/SmtB family transcription factor [Terriglobia bacterium]
MRSRKSTKAGHGTKFGETAFRDRDLESLYAMQAEICQALGHPRRIHIVDLLAHGESSAADLRSALGVSKVNLSQHLSLLKQVGLVQSRQSGREAFYFLVIPEIKDACQLVRKVLALRLQHGTRLAKTLRAESTKIATQTALSL